MTWTLAFKAVAIAAIALTVTAAAMLGVLTLAARAVRDVESCEDDHPNNQGRGR